MSEGFDDPLPIDPPHDPPPAVPPRPPAPAVTAVRAPVAPPVEEAAGRSIFPAVLGVLFLGAIVGSVVMERMPAPPAQAAQTTTASEASTSTPPKTESATPPGGDDVKALQARVEELTKKLDAMPKPEPAPDLKPIQDKLDTLSKAVESSGDAPKKVEEIVGMLPTMEKELAAVKAENEALKAQVAALDDKMKAMPAPTTSPAANPAEAAKPAPPAMSESLTEGVALFKQNKFADALTALKKDPKDARALDFAALASGFATNNWKGEAVELATQGVQAEKAGSPPKPEIDAAFAGLTDAQGKAWLDFYRKVAAK